MLYCSWIYSRIIGKVIMYLRSWFCLLILFRRHFSVRIWPLHASKSNRLFCLCLLQCFAWFSSSSTLFICLVFSYPTPSILLFYNSSQPLFLFEFSCCSSYRTSLVSLSSCMCVFYSYTRHSCLVLVFLSPHMLCLVLSYFLTLNV